MVERMHRTLKEALTAANKKDWSSQLPWTLLQMKNGKGADIPYSPVEIAIGGASRQLLDLTLNF